MGFLLGAFGKLAAGQRYRLLQARMMRIQSRLRRATRDAADMEKMINRQEKAALNSLTVQSNSALTIAKNGALASIFSQAGAQELMNKAQSNPVGMTQEETQKYNGMMSQVSQLQTNMSAVCETNTAYTKQQIQDYFEQLRDMQLEPLKDEEDLLQSEKDSLESQLQTAKTDYEACQKMEQSDAKMLAPNYTAG